MHAFSAVRYNNTINQINNRFLRELLRETFRNIGKYFGISYLPNFIYVIPTYRFRLEMLLEIIPTPHLSIIC